jgi:hypothetical protein
LKVSKPKLLFLERAFNPKRSLLTLRFCLTLANGLSSTARRPHKLPAHTVKDLRSKPSGFNFFPARRFAPGSRASYTSFRSRQHLTPNPAASNRPLSAERDKRRSEPAILHHRKGMSTVPALAVAPAATTRCHSRHDHDGSARAPGLVCMAALVMLSALSAFRGLSMASRIPPDRRIEGARPHPTASRVVR